MYLKINKSWKNTNDYISSLKTKYRKKINIIIKNSSAISTNEIEQENFSIILIIYKVYLIKLFINLVLMDLILMLIRYTK
ncbi:MAG: hypothetical protein CM15mP112_05800 [Flavobacteriales bacterium]|nr:MAG: hypothetical protein CM15mP112_05800 [Flavobacteriales bacterium]